MNNEEKIQQLKEKIEKNKDRIEYLEENNRRLLFFLGINPQPFSNNLPKFLKNIELKSFKEGEDGK